MNNSHTKTPRRSLAAVFSIVLVFLLLVLMICVSTAKADKLETKLDIADGNIEIEWDDTALHWKATQGVNTISFGPESSLTITGETDTYVINIDGTGANDKTCNLLLKELKIKLKPMKNPTDNASPIKSANFPDGASLALTLDKASLEAAMAINGGYDGHACLALGTTDVSLTIVGGDQNMIRAGDGTSGSSGGGDGSHGISAGSVTITGKENTALWVYGSVGCDNGHVGGDGIYAQSVLINGELGGALDLCGGTGYNEGNGGRGVYCTTLRLENEGRATVKGGDSPKGKAGYGVEAKDVSVLGEGYLTINGGNYAGSDSAFGAAGAYITGDLSVEGGGIFHAIGGRSSKEQEPFTFAGLYTRGNITLKNAGSIEVQGRINLAGKSSHGIYMADPDKAITLWDNSRIKAIGGEEAMPDDVIGGDCGVAIVASKINLNDNSRIEAVGGSSEDPSYYGGIGISSASNGVGVISLSGRSWLTVKGGNSDKVNNTASALNNMDIRLESPNALMQVKNGATNTDSFTAIRGDAYNNENYVFKLGEGAKTNDALTAQQILVVPPNTKLGWVAMESVRGTVTYMGFEDVYMTPKSLNTNPSARLSRPQ